MFSICFGIGDTYLITIVDVAFGRFFVKISNRSLGCKGILSFMLSLNTTCGVKDYDYNI